MSAGPPPLPGQQGYGPGGYRGPGGASASGPYAPGPARQGPYTPAAGPSFPPPQGTPAYGAEQAPPPLPGAPAIPDPGPLPDPGRMPDPAALHVTESTRTYPCPACGANLVFDPATQGLLCPACGHRAGIDLTPAGLAKHDIGRSMTYLAQFAASPASLTREVVCQSCGGHTTFDGTTTATRCPFCNTPVQRDDLKDAPARLPVDGLLPFRVSQQQATAQIEAWINSRWFAPNEFKKYRTLGSFTSIYLTYFAYDVETTSRYSGMRGDTYYETVRRGDQTVQEARTRWTPVSGAVAVDAADLPALANTGLDGDKVAALEPWPAEQAVPYQQVFLAGHASRTYDATPDVVFEQIARPRVEAMIDSAVRSDIGGDQQQVSSLDTSYHRTDFAHLLLPVWLLTVTYQSRPFQVFINGITGEVQGQRPYSTVKIALAVIAGLIVIGVLVALYGAYGQNG